MPRFYQAESAEAIQRIWELFKEYGDWLGEDLYFQGFEEELSGLPGEYAPPEGRLWLIEVNGENAGCAALRKFSDGICEMKRMYLRPHYRGRGIGRTIAERLIAEARAIGYLKMRLDTLERMKEATALYRSLGFKDIPPYRYNPIEGAVYLELELKSE